MLETILQFASLIYTGLYVSIVVFAGAYVWHGWIRVSTFRRMRSEAWYIQLVSPYSLIRVMYILGALCLVTIIVDAVRLYIFYLQPLFLQDVFLLLTAMIHLIHVYKQMLISHHSEDWIRYGRLAVFGLCILGVVALGARYSLRLLDSFVLLIPTYLLFLSIFGIDIYTTHKINTSLTTMRTLLGNKYDLSPVVYVQWLRCFVVILGVSKSLLTIILPFTIGGPLGQPTSPPTPLTYDAIIEHVVRILESTSATMTVYVYILCWTMIFYYIQMALTKNSTPIYAVQSGASIPLESLETDIA